MLVETLSVFMLLLIQINGFNAGLTVRETIKGSDSDTALIFNISIEYLRSIDNATLDVMLTSNATGFTVEPSSVVTGPDNGAKSRYQLNGEHVLWIYSQLANGESPHIAYKAKPVLGGKDLPEGKSYYDASVMYSVQPAINGTSFFGPLVSQFCLERVDIRSTGAEFNKSLIAVTVVFGFLAGVILVLLVLFGIYRLAKRNPFTCWKKTTSNNSLKAAQNSTGNISEASESIFARKHDKLSGKQNLIWTDSVVSILRISNRNDVVREIERLDIEDTGYLCRDIEQQKDETMTNLVVDFVRNLGRGTQNKKAKNKFAVSFLGKLESWNMKMEEDFEKKSMNVKDSRRETAEKQSEELSEKHNRELDLFTELCIGRHAREEARSAQKLLAEKQGMERNLLQYRIDLISQELMENMLSKFFTEKHMVRRELLLSYLREISRIESLLPDPLVSDFDQLETEVNKIFVIAQTAQLKSLAEKFSRRKCLVKTQELARSHSKDLLNTLALHLLQLVTFAKKSGKLPPSDARRLKDDVIGEVEDIRKSGEEMIKKRERELLTTLNSAKRSQIMERVKLNERKLAEVRKKQKSVGSKDYINYVETVVRSSTQSQQELIEYEIVIDLDHASDVSRLHEVLQDEMKDALLKSKDTLVRDLRDIGIQSSKLRPLLERHDDELKELDQLQQKEAKELANSLKNQLAEGAVHLNGGWQHKHQLEEQLDAYKQTVTRNLINSQMSLSAEQQLRLRTGGVAVEGHSCHSQSQPTLDKLKYRKMIEENLTIQENDRLEKLEQDLKKKLRYLEKRQFDYSDDDNDDDSKSKIQNLSSLFEDHYKQCLAVLNGEETRVQAEKVSKEFNKEQASRLKEEEEDLAIRLVKMQMAKANDLANLDNQRNSLQDATCCLMRELVEQSRLSVSDCQKILQLHEKELRLIAGHMKDDERIRTLTNEKQQQTEQILKQKMEDRSNQTSKSQNKLGDKLCKILAAEERLIQQNSMRTQFEREAQQEVEEFNRTDRLNRTYLILDKELELLARVLRGAGYKSEDVEGIICSRFLRCTFIDWRNFLDKYRKAERSNSIQLTRDLNESIQRSSTANQNSLPKLDRSDEPRLGLKFGKLHPLPSSVVPMSAYGDVDPAASTSKVESYLYRKPNKPNSTDQLSQTVPSRLAPITPSVGFKQKKSVRLEEAQNEYWSG